MTRPEPAPWWVVLVAVLELALVAAIFGCLAWLFVRAVVAMIPLVEVVR